MSKKDKDKKKKGPKVHKDLEGLEININEFGEISSNIDLEKINTFLNKNVDDKKLKGRKFDESGKEVEDEEDDKED